MIIEIDGHKFDAVFEKSKSPKTCEVFRKAMPFEGDLVHVRWSLVRRSACLQSMVVDQSALKQLLS